MIDMSIKPNTKSSADYRKRAEECVELAQTARTQQQRTMLLHIAETWLRLADHALSDHVAAEQNVTAESVVKMN